MAKLATRPGRGVVDALLGDLDVLRPQQGRLRGSTGAGFLRFSPRAAQLWRFALGSNAAVIKKINRGGTHTAKDLRAQFDYLFSKSEAIFGNAVSHDPNARGLAAEERREIAETWGDDWRGAPKNGHTTHLLLSFPSHVAPGKAKLIAEAWAFEMFQSGAHQAEEWAYVAALHTDRAHPHVHVVVNNRGLMDGQWFYMAREHAFNLDMMKTRMVEIAAEEGVFLDATSRAERGILSYGPSRAEIERAKVQGRAPEERMREGRALDEALASMSRSAETLRGLAHLAALTGLDEIATRIGAAEAALARGGIVNTFPAAEHRDSRVDLERHFEGWMGRALERIGARPEQEQLALREELFGHARDVLDGLGDRRGAQLLEMPAQSEIYGRPTLSRRADAVRQGLPDKRDPALDISEKISALGVQMGLEPRRLRHRIERGAANAFEERLWVRDDLRAVAAHRNLDLEDRKQRSLAGLTLGQFYDQAEALIEAGHQREHDAQSARLLGTMRAMARTIAATGAVCFGSDEEAQRFAADLRQRYGKGIASDLVAGRTEALMQDFPEQRERQAVALAVVSAARAHPGMGVTLREAERAEVRHRGKDRELE